MTICQEEGRKEGRTKKDRKEGRKIVSSMLGKYSNYSLMQDSNDASGWNSNIDSRIMP